MTDFGSMIKNVLDNTQRPHGLGVTDPQVVGSMINDAIAKICEKCGTTEKSITITFATSKDDYSIATDLVVADLMHIRTLYTPLLGDVPQLSPEQILELRRSATTAQGYTTAYALLGLDTFMVYPTQTAGATASLLYGFTPALLVGDAEITPYVPTAYHYVVEMLATARAARTKDWAAAGQMQLEADHHVGQVLAYMDRRSGGTPQRIRQGPRRSFRRSVPSQDWGA